MSITNFPNGIWAPNLGGNTLMTQNGIALYVDPVNGNDGDTGDSPGTAIKTLPRALQLCVAGRGDVVYLFNNGLSTGTARLTSKLSWNKANTHLVGVCAPVAMSQRARVSNLASGATGPSTLFELAAPGCIIQNIEFFHGYPVAEAQICFSLTSAAQRNYISNCHLAGIGDATGDLAGSMSLSLGGAENVFDHCTIGLDTILRTTAAAEVVVTVGTRNIFRDCLFNTAAGAAGFLYVSAAASTLDRFLLFQRCLFINSIQSGATTMTAVMSINGGGSPGGFAILDDCKTFGATYWVGADTAKVMLLGDPGAANSQLIGIGLTADKP